MTLMTLENEPFLALEKIPWWRQTINSLKLISIGSYSA